MHLEFLESAEFYNRRYHNFSSRVIFPMSLLVVFTFGFAMFAEKEISLSSKATVEPSRIIANIQSTSNRRMVVNYLEENKQVQRGDLLVQYQEVGDVIQDEANVNQLESFRNHQSKTSNLKNSTTQPNIGLFSQNSSTVQEQIALEQDDLERVMKHSEKIHHDLSEVMQGATLAPRMVDGKIISMDLCKDACNHKWSFDAEICKLTGGDEMLKHQSALSAVKEIMKQNTILSLTDELCSLSNQGVLTKALFEEKKKKI